MTEQTSSKRPAKTKNFTAGERAAMKERSRELKAEASSAEGESAVLAKIAEMPDADRALAQRLHDLIRAAAPALAPKTWYGMPAYTREGKVVCFFQAAQKFKSKYATLGFSDEAQLDDGELWPVAYALKEWTADVEARIVGLVRRAAG